MICRIWDLCTTLTSVFCPLLFLGSTKKNHKCLLKSFSPEFIHSFISGLTPSFSILTFSSKTNSHSRLFWNCFWIIHIFSFIYTIRNIRHSSRSKSVQTIKAELLKRNTQKSPSDENKIIAEYMRKVRETLTCNRNCYIQEDLQFLLCKSEAFIKFELDTIWKKVPIKVIQV